MTQDFYQKSIEQVVQMCKTDLNKGLTDDVVREKQSAKALTLLVMLVPAMQSLFRLTSLTAAQWWIVSGLSAGVLALSEFFKLFTRNRE